MQTCSVKRFVIPIFLLLPQVLVAVAKAGDLDPITVTPGNSAAGASTIYKIDFEVHDFAPSNLPADGQIKVYFPAGFDISDVHLADSEDESIDGGFSVSTNSDSGLVTITRDGTGTTKDASADLSISIATVDNITTPADTFRLTLETWDVSLVPAQRIDGPSKSQPFSIIPGPLHHFDLVLFASPISITAGDVLPGTVTVTARDEFDNVVSDYSGSIWFNSTSAGTITYYNLANSYTFQPADNGQHVFPGSDFQLTTAGSHIINVTDGTISQPSAPVSISAGPISSFTLGNPTTQTAGAAFSLIVSGAEDVYNNIASGTLTVTATAGGSNAPDGTPPVLHDIEVVDGSGSGAQTLYRAESGVRLRAQRGAGVSQTTDPFNVGPGTTLGSFGLAGYPAITTAGENFGANDVTVTAYDLWGNVKTDFAGTVWFTSIDGQAVIVHNAGNPETLPGGSRVFPGNEFELRTAGQQKLRVTDGAIVSLSDYINVLATTIDDFTVSAGTTQRAGSAFSLAITDAVDEFGNSASGTVLVGVISGGGDAPDGTSPQLSDVVVVNGSGTAQQILYNAVVTELEGRIGTSAYTTGAITILPGDLDHFTMTGYPDRIRVGINFGADNVTVTAYDSYDNRKTDYTGQVYFNTTDPSATVPYDINNRYTFVPGDNGAHTFAGTGFSFGTPGLQTLTVLDYATGIHEKSTDVDVYGVEIASVNCSRGSVTQGQDSVRVTLVVRNYGASFFAITSAGLNFTDQIAQNRDSDYAVVRTDGVTQIAPGGQQSLTFRVDVLPTAATGTITVDGSVTGNYGGAPLPASSAAVKHNWTVQTPPSLVISTFYIQPDTVFQGDGNVPMSVRVGNLGSLNASALVDSIAFAFKRDLVTVTNEYTVTPGQGYPVSISADQEWDFQFSIDVSRQATSGFIEVDARVYARDVNSANPYTADSAFPEFFTLEERPSLEILSIRASQPTVTQDQTAHWTVTIGLRNGSTRDLVIALAPSKTFVSFHKGAQNLTSEYGIAWPTQLEGGGLVLEGGSDPDSLVFIIAPTGHTIGDVTIGARVESSDGTYDDSGHSGIYGGVTVQKIPILLIDEVATSVESVTIAQTKHWNIDVHVRNSGGSAIIVDFDQSSVGFSPEDPQGVEVVNPTSLLNGDDAVLEPASSDVLRYTVTNTRVPSGVIAITANVQGNNANSGSPLSQTAYGSILAQTAADLEITGVEVSDATVTAGQSTDWTVTVHVANFGESDVRLNLAEDATYVSFTPPLSGSAVAWPTAFENSETTRLLGNTTDDLVFIVEETGQAAGMRVVNARVQATEINSDSLLSDDTSDSGSGTVIVQTRAELSYVLGSVAPSNVNRGNFVSFSVRVHNDGESTVLLDQEDSWIRILDGAGHAFQAALNTSVVSTVGPGDTTLTFFSTQMPSSMNVDEYNPTIRISGTENRNDFVQSLSVADKVAVGPEAALEISSTEASQDKVTKGQAKPWYMSVNVVNNGLESVRLDSSQIKLYHFGTDVTSEYVILTPATFEGSGTNQLDGGAQDELRFQVTQTTASTLGVIRIYGEVWVTEVDDPNNHLYAESNSQSGFFTVQSPAVLNVDRVRPSQVEVTRGQTTDWHVSVIVSNTGGSDLTVSIDDTLSYISFSGGNGWQTTGPEELAGGGLTLEAGSVDSLIYTVNTTADTTGAITINTRVQATEDNSDSVLVDISGSPEAGTVILEKPAVLQVVSLGIEAPNKPYVNTGQGFSIHVDVENSGEDGADDVVLAVFSDAELSSFEPNVNVGTVGGGQKVTATHSAIASSIEDTSEILSTYVQSGIGGNDGQPIVVKPAASPSDSSYEIIIQKPAGLDILSVEADPDTVVAEQTSFWVIRVSVQDTGSASLMLDLPRADDIVFRIGGEEQTDYSVSPPAELNGGGLLLSAGEVDTFEYTVFKTGARGGQVQIVVGLGATDRNDPDRILRADGNGRVFVSSPAIVQIVSTAPKAKNVGPDERAHVNVHQAFEVHVAVANKGDEGLSDVVVSLSTEYSQAPQDKVLPTIGVGQTDTAKFVLQADSVRHLNGETVRARIDAARGSSSGLAAEIREALDATATIVIHDSARVRIKTVAHAGPNPGFLSKEQSFPIDVVLENQGSESARDVQIRLEALPSESVTPSTAQTQVGFVAGLSDTTRAMFSFAAGTRKDAVRFYAFLDAAYGANTLELATIEAPVLDSCLVIIQDPASPQTVDIFFSKDTVEAESTERWEFEVEVTNAGEASAVFLPPTLDDVTIIIADSEQTHEYQIVPPLGFKGSGGNILAGGATDSYVFAVLETGALGGQANLSVELQAYDMNVGDSGPPFQLVEEGDFYVATNAVARIQRTEVITPNVTDVGVGVVNTEQQFGIRVTVEEKQGREGLDDVALRLIRPDDSFLVSDTTIVIPFIEKNDTASATFQVTAPAGERESPQLFRVRIDSAIAHESQVPATIDRVEGQEEARVMVREPANLQIELALNQGGDVLTINQTFDVVVDISNLGSAETDTGWFSLTPPENYRLIVAPDTSDTSVTVPFYLGLYTSVDKRLTAIAPAVPSEGDSFIAVISTVPTDVNCGQPANIAGERDTLIVRTVSSGIAVEDIYVGSPEGAMDDTLSTEQDFTITAQIIMSPDLRQRTATLRLPVGSGYQLLEDSTKSLNAEQQTVGWHVEAPTDADPQPVTLTVVASGVDGLGNTLEEYGTLRLLTVKRAIVSLDENLAIIEPAGSASGELSLGQRFKLQATVRNAPGAAGTTGTGKLKLSFGQTGVTLDTGEQDSIKTFQAGESVYWWLKAPDEPKSSATLKVAITDRPNDENSGGPVELSNTESFINVRTLDRGFVKVDTVFVSAPEGAKDGTISTGQAFTITAEISSARVAGDTLSATLSASNEEYFSETWVKRVAGGEGVKAQWRVEAPSPLMTTGFHDTLWVTARAYDWRDTDLSLEHQSVALPLLLQKRTDFRLFAEVYQPAEAARDRKVSADQTFDMRAWVQVTGEASLYPEDVFTAQITLPSGGLYQVEGPLEQSSASGELVWRCRAPGAPSPASEGEFEFQLIDWPRDLNSGERLSVPADTDDKVAVTTVSKAQLVAAAEISEPPDAVGGDVRVGQHFVIRGFVENRGEAGYKSPPDFQFELALPEDYTTEDELVKSSSTGQTEWVVTAPLLTTAHWDTIFVRVLDVGLDQYSDQKAEVLGDSTANFLVRALSAVVYLDDYTVDNRTSAMKGGRSVPLLGMRFFNPGIETSRFVLEQLSVDLQDRNGNGLSPSGVISRIAAVPRGYPEVPYVELRDIPSENPLTLDLTAGGLDTLVGSHPDSVELLVDILPTTNVSDFMLGIDSSLSVFVRDVESGQRVMIADSLGNPVFALNLKSDYRVVVEGGFEGSFGNFPNPFGGTDRPAATFIYNLDANADIEVRIYSLIGELVWSKHYPRSSPEGQEGPHEGEILWDGRNGRGQRVLNGMYIARITTSTGQTASTKIGVLR